MKLQTRDGRLFTLTVQGYEFPDEELGPTEDNPADDFCTGRFLIVSHKFHNSDGQWDAGGPTMTTTELQRLADWLGSVRDGNPSAVGVYFTERDLEFTVDKPVMHLCVHVFWDFLPPWAPSGSTITIQFPLQEIDLHSVTESLTRQIADFPGRPPLSHLA